MSRENGTTAQGPKTHATASSESMGQWGSARQAVQPPHTLWPRIGRFLTWSENDRFWLGQNRTSIFFPPHIPCDTVSRGGTPRPVPPHGFSAPHLILGGPPTTQAERHQTDLEVRTHILALAGKNADLVKNSRFRVWSKISIFQALANTCQKAVANTGRAFLPLLYYDSFYFLLWLFGSFYSLWYI
jgi:hypothetical protein